MNGFYIGEVIDSLVPIENDFSFEKLFTKNSKIKEDTIMSFATIEWLIKSDHSSEKIIEIIKKYYHKYDDIAKGSQSKIISKMSVFGEIKHLVSKNNKGLARVSPIGWYAKSIDEIKELIEKNTAPTHNSYESRKACELFAISIFMFRNNITNTAYKKYIKENYGFVFSQSFEELKKTHINSNEAIDTLSTAIQIVLHADDFHDSIKKVLILKEYNKTLLSVTSALSEAYFQDIPQETIKMAKKYLPKGLKDLLGSFNKQLEKSN